MTLNAMKSVYCLSLTLSMETAYKEVKEMGKIIIYNLNKFR